MDNIFVVLERGFDELYLFFDKINEFDEHVKFTLTVEKKCNLPFLDVHLIQNEECLIIDRTAYRKPTRSDITISSNSFSPFLYKIAAFSFYIRRTFKVCAEKYLVEKHNIFRVIA